MGRRRRPVAPPSDLDGYPELCQALRDLMTRRGISQRELVRRDETRRLRRSTVSAALRMERRLERGAMIAIVRACGVGDAALDDWAAAWDRLAPPHWQAMERRRRYLAQCYAVGSHRWSRSW